MTFLIIAALLVILDQVSKFMVRTTLALGETMNLIPGVVTITHVQNKGAAFSLFADNPKFGMILIGVSLVVSVLLILAIALRWLRHSFGRFTLMLLLAGAVGNLIDRVVHNGQVTDMIQAEFLPFRFPVFNIADILVVLGGVLLVIYVLFFWDRCERIYGKREVRKGRKKQK